MLEEVRGSVGLVGLSTATGVNEDANRAGLRPWVVLRRDLVPSA